MYRYPIFVLLFAILSSQTSFADIFSTFDSGDEGWIANGGVLTFNATGGNPGGFISVADDDNTFMTVEAPTAFSGDLSRFLLGSVSFDAKNLNGSPPNLIAGTFGTVTITGSAATATRILGGPNEPPVDDNWHTYDALLIPADWTGDLEAALSDVLSITVELESNETVPAETNGFDNFRLFLPEPEILLGDVNLDGVVNFLDISPFISILSDGEFQAEADVNQNGIVDFLDIGPFIGVLAGSQSI